MARTLDATLTPNQRAQRAQFNTRAASLVRRANLTHYDKPRFGPWCPYWTVYHRVRQLPLGSRVLVVGCGTGRDALIYAREGYRVDAIDISDVSIAVAHERAVGFNLADRVRFSAHAAEQLPFADGSFDAVVGTNVLHHVDDLLAALREADRVLTRDGVAIFKEPLATPVWDWFRARPPFTWIVPTGVKNRATGERYPQDGTAGEHMLTPADLAAMRDIFGALRETRFHLLAKCASLTGHRHAWERLDHLAFRVLPLLRRAGDQVVLEMRKSAPHHH